MVRNDHLVHALKVVDTYQFKCTDLQIGFFGNFTGNAFFGRFTGLHETRDECKLSASPGRISGQQNLIAHLDDACQNRCGVVPMREVTLGTTQAKFFSTILHLRQPRQGSTATRAKAIFDHAGNTPVER